MATSHVHQHRWAAVLHMIPWAHPSPQPKRHLDQFSRFAQVTAECPYTLQWGALPPQNCPFSWGSGPHLIYGCPQPKRHLDRCSRFAGLTSVTDRPTDRATRSVTICRIYVRSTAMRPNNNGKSRMVALELKTIIQTSKDFSECTFANFFFKCQRFFLE